MSSTGHHHVIRSQPAGLVIACDPPREWGGIAFLSLWLVAWSIGGFAGVVELLDPNLRSGVGAAFLLVWFLTTVMALGVIAWQLVGREELVFTASQLTHQWRVAGVGRTKVYSLDRVRHFREIEYVEPSWATQYTLVPPGIWTPHGVLAFDYEGQTVRAGAGLRPGDAERIVTELRRRMPRLVAG